MRNHATICSHETWQSACEITTWTAPCPTEVQRTLEFITSCRRVMPFQCAKNSFRYNGDTTFKQSSIFFQGTTQTHTYHIQLGQSIQSIRRRPICRSFQRFYHTIMEWFFWSRKKNRQCEILTRDMMVLLRGGCINRWSFWTWKHSMCVSLSIFAGFKCDMLSCPWARSLSKKDADWRGCISW